MKKFANFYGDIDSRTFTGLSGIGDLMLTAFGKLSRNRTFGYRLA
jgi:glycerol-3-phosphate dehydrogenase